MQEIHLGDQIIRYDREKTKVAYATIGSGSPEKCGCQFCRNFAAQRKLIYPQHFQELLDRLGIDPGKEGMFTKECHQEHWWGTADGSTWLAKSLKRVSG